MLSLPGSHLRRCLPADDAFHVAQGLRHGEHGECQKEECRGRVLKPCFTLQSVRLLFHSAFASYGKPPRPRFQAYMNPNGRCFSFDQVRPGPRYQNLSTSFFSSDFCEQTHFRETIWISTFKLFWHRSFAGCDCSKI